MIEPTIDIKLILGHVEVYSWLEPTEDGYRGMGRSVHFDGDGKVIKDITEPTGVSLSLA